MPRAVPAKGLDLVLVDHQLGGEGRVDGCQLGVLCPLLAGVAAVADVDDARGQVCGAGVGEDVGADGVTCGVWGSASIRTLTWTSM